MFGSLLSNGCSLCRWGESVNGDRARLRAAVETNSASATVVAGVAGRMHAIVVQFSSQFQALRRAGLNAQPTAFAFLDIDYDFAACRSRHGSPRNSCLRRLRMLQPLGRFAVLIQPVAKCGMRNIDERLGAFANRFAVQVGDSVFGNDIANAAARVYDPGSRIEHGINARDGSVLLGG